VLFFYGIYIFDDLSWFPFVNRVEVKLKEGWYYIDSSTSSLSLIS